MFLLFEATSAKTHFLEQNLEKLLFAQKFVMSKHYLATKQRREKKANKTSWRNFPYCLCAVAMSATMRARWMKEYCPVMSTQPILVTLGARSRWRQ